MALKRKILCITSAALLSASVYASDSADLGTDDDQASAPTAVGVVNWTVTLKTVSKAAVCSGGTYWALNEMNRRMNMGIQNPYITSVAAVIAVVGLYGGGELFASAPTEQGHTGLTATGLEDASPSRTAKVIDIDPLLKEVETATGPFSNARNHAAAYSTLKSAVTQLNSAVQLLRNRKDHYQSEAERLQKKLENSSSEASELKEENITLRADAKHFKSQLAKMEKKEESSSAALKEKQDELKSRLKRFDDVLAENQQLKVEAARNEGKDKRIQELVDDLSRVKKNLQEEQAARSKQQTEAGSAILKLNGDIERLRKRLDKAQSTVGSMVDPSECAASEAGRSVASTMRRNVETFFGEILEKDEREALRRALEKFREEKTKNRKKAEESSAALTAEATAAVDDVV